MINIKKNSINSIVDSFNDMFVSKCLKTNIENKEDSYELYCEVPGINKDKIDISICDDTIYIFVENEHEDNSEYIIRERCTQSIRRSFKLEDIDSSSIKATLNDGLLHIKINKLNNSLAKRTIEIE